MPPGTLEPDQFLFEKGNEALNEKKWLTAREFFKQVTETYTQSPLRPDAKLGIGDTYLGEGIAEALVLAINEFQEFLSFYPTHARADYAQYKLGMAHFRQMRAPQRDQTETRDAIRELRDLRGPLSEQQPDAGGEGEAARGARSAERSRSIEVGVFYYRHALVSGRHRSAQTGCSRRSGFTGATRVYFYLAESLLKVKPQAEALPYFEKLVQEFEQSEHLEEARKRIDELKATPDAEALAAAVRVAD